MTILPTLLRAGWLRVVSISGADVRLHWTLPLGLLFFARGTWAPGAFVGFLALVLLHELGHALLVRRYRLRVLSIDLHALGGVCRYVGQATEWQSAVIAWGGVLAQAVVLAVIQIVAIFAPLPKSTFVVDLVSTLVFSNLLLLVLNLLPLKGLDGWQAWRLPILAVRKLRDRSPKVTPPPSETPKGDIVEEMERIIRERSRNKPS